MSDLVMASLPYYKLKNNKIVTITRKNMYKIGPTNFLLAFGAHLGNQHMNFIYNAAIYLSRKDVGKSMVMDEHMLNHYSKIGHKNKKKYEPITQKLSEIIVSEMALLKDRTMRYPVLVLGLEDKIKQDTIDHFEMLGYEDLKL